MDVEELLQEIAILEGQESDEALALLHSYSELLETLIHKEEDLKSNESSSPIESDSEGSDPDDQTEWAWMRVEEPRTTSLVNQPSETKQMHNQKERLFSQSQTKKSPPQEEEEYDPFEEKGVFETLQQGKPAEDYDPFEEDEEYVTLSGKEEEQTRLVDWEQHTTGFGSRMLLKLGFIPGTGLGSSKRQGIVAPIDVTLDASVVGSSYGLGHHKRRAEGDNKPPDVGFLLKSNRSASFERRKKDTNTFFSFLNSSIQPRSSDEDFGAKSGSLSDLSNKKRKREKEEDSLRLRETTSKPSNPSLHAGRMKQDEMIDVLQAKKQKLEEGISRNKGKGHTTTVKNMQRDLDKINQKLSHLGARQHSLSQKLKKEKQKADFLKF